jgi:hypothetical protein
MAFSTGFEVEGSSSGSVVNTAVVYYVLRTSR